MLVKIGDRIYSPEQEIIAIKFSKKDIENINMMAEQGNYIYVVYPDDEEYTSDHIERFVKGYDK